MTFCDTLGPQSSTSTYFVESVSKLQRCIAANGSHKVADVGGTVSMFRQQL